MEPRGDEAMRTSKLNVLFVGSRNKRRSSTAEKIYQRVGRVYARSRGTSRNVVRSIPSVDLAWADVVMVMAHKPSQRIRADFSAAVQFTPMDILENNRRFFAKMTRRVKHTVDARVVS